MSAPAANPTPAILLALVTLLFMVTWQNDHGLSPGPRSVSRCEVRSLPQERRSLVRPTSGVAAHVAVASFRRVGPSRN